MMYSDADLDRRLQLARELTSTHEEPVLTRGLVDLRLAGPGRHLALDFPADYAPAASTEPAGDPNHTLPRADAVVLTYTSDEAKALADVLTPGRFSADWTHYTHNYKRFLTQIREGAPARKAGRLASYCQTRIGTLKVLVMKSELHLNQDVYELDGKPTLPIRALFEQIIREVKPSHFFCIGTAGGVYLRRPLGTVVASRATQFRCQKEFKNEPFAQQAFRSEWQLPHQHRNDALRLMKQFTEQLAVPANSPVAQCPCSSLQGSEAPAATFLFDGQDSIPAYHPVLTTDFFEFGTDRNELYRDGIAVEMDDAALGLACADLAQPPKWASIRNYSDPAINGSLPMRDQESCASKLYLKYGYWTSVLGAIATWSILAGLAD